MRSLLTIFSISLFSLGLISCESMHNADRIEKIKNRMDALQNSENYFSDSATEELQDIRTDLVETLLDEGEREMSLIGISGHENAQSNAKNYFELVNEISSRRFSMTALELKQQWTWLKEWAWKGGFDVFTYGRAQWNLWKVACPILWVWTVPESIVCILADVIGHWETQSIQFHLEALPSQYAERAQSHLEQLSKISVDEIRDQATSRNNIEIVMTYRLMGNESQLAFYEMAVNRRNQLPGERKGIIGSVRYQDMWNELAEAIRQIREGGEIGYLSEPEISAVRGESPSFLMNKNSIIEIRIRSVGFIPYLKIEALISQLSRNEADEDDKLTVTLEPFNPNDSR